MSLFHAQTTRDRNRRAELPRRGFTLVELVVVLVLVAILSAAAVPAMSVVSETRARVAARQVVRDLGFAREHAIATGAGTWVVFDVNVDRYTMLTESTASPGRAAAISLDDPATGRPFLQQFGQGDFAGVDLVSATIGSGAEVGFDWLGKPRDAGANPLTSAGTVVVGGHTVTIEPETGLARRQ